MHVHRGQFRCNDREPSIPRISLPHFALDSVALRRLPPEFRGQCGTSPKTIPTCGKKGRIPYTVGPILDRLQLDQKGWCDLVAHFGRRFFVVAGAPTTIDDTTSRINQHRYHVTSATRQLYRDVESRKASTA